MNMEFNKIFAAVLVAGIIASLSGFLAKEIMHPHELHENAYKIEGAENFTPGSVKKQQLPEPILALIAGADVARGEKLSRACAACHTFNQGEADGIGPNLWNVMSRGKASESGFAYSDALQALGGDWNYAELNKFLWKPKSYAKGTKMNYIGLKKPEDRAAVIAWLRGLSGSPVAYPTDGEIAAEEAALKPPSEEPAPVDEQAASGDNGSH